MWVGILVWLGQHSQTFFMLGDGFDAEQDQVWFFHCYVCNSFGFQAVWIRGQAMIGSSWSVTRPDNVIELYLHFSLYVYCMVSVWHSFVYFSSLLAVCQAWRRTWDGSTCYGYLWKSNEGSVTWRNVWGKRDQSVTSLSLWQIYPSGEWPP